MVHGVAGKPSGLCFAKVILAGVLMPNGDGRCCRLVTYAIGHEQDGRASVAGFKLVGDPLQSVALLLFGLELLGF